MADRSLRPCKKMGCPELTRDSTGYCDKHRHIHEEQQKKRWTNSDKNRKSARQRGYTSKWDKERKGYLIKHPLCVECEKEGRYIPATVVDHIKPHKGDMKLFWDKDNWQPLCKRHHDIKTAKEDGGFGNVVK